MREPVIEIVDFNHDGRGRGVYDGRTYLVTQAYPGESVTVQIDRESSKTVQGRVLDVVQKATERIESPCIHLNQCTGCPFIAASSNLEASFKRTELLYIFRESGCGHDNIQYLRPTGAYHYRHYAKWNLLEQNGRISVGAYVMGTHVLIENEKCQVVTPLIQRVVSRVLDILNRLKVRVHKEEVKGLRYLVVRQSHLDDELLDLVDSRPLYETTALRDQLKSEIETMSEQMDIAWMVNVDDGNVLISNEWSLIGRLRIKRVFGGLNFRSGRNHFSDQSEAAERMFATLSSGLLVVEF